MANKGKFREYLTDMMLYSEGRAKRGWTIDSNFPNAGYIAKGKSIIFVAGKNGMLSIDIEKVDEFCQELKDIKEIVVARKQAGFQ